MGCSDNNSIIAIAETEPVKTSGDAADDPAIVINYNNPQQSIILGTDKRAGVYACLLYTSPSPRDQRGSRMPSSA